MLILLDDFLFFFKQKLLIASVWKAIFKENNIENVNEWEKKWNDNDDGCS